MAYGADDTDATAKAEADALALGRDIVRLLLFLALLLFLFYQGWTDYATMAALAAGVLFPSSRFLGNVK